MAPYQSLILYTNVRWHMFFLAFFPNVEIIDFVTFTFNEGFLLPSPTIGV